MAKNFFVFCIFTISLILLIMPVVTSVSIQGPEDKSIVFQPGIERTYTFRIFNSAKIHSYIAGDLTQYVTLIDDAPDSGSRTITVDVRLPDTLLPGRYTILVGAKEMAENEGMVGALAAIQTRIPVLVLYPGKYPEFSLSINDLNVNESANIIVNLHNYGIENILSAYALIDIYDAENNTIMRDIMTDAAGVDSNKDTALNAVFDSSRAGLKPGIYRAVARLYYDGILLNNTRERVFMIGQMNIEITASTSEVYVNAINKYQLTITSDWSGDIKDVYAILRTPDGQLLKTPNADLIKPLANTEQARATLETYWDVKDLEKGLYDVNVDIHYNKLVASKTVKVAVIEGVAPVIEQPAEFQILNIKGDKIIILNTTLSLSLFLMIILAMVVVFNIYYLVYRRKSGNSNNAQGNSLKRDIPKPPVPPGL